MSSKALEGIKVAALIQGITGPLTAATLASHGAQVLRIESHTRIEWHRQAGPFIGEVVHPDRSALYLIMNPGSYGITLNLKHPRAMEVMSRIIKWVDVVVENFAGGVMKRMGMGYEDLKKINPAIIMLSAAIYGQTGPYGEVPGYGGTLTALTGLPYVTGFPDQMPQFPGMAITDFIAPRANVLAIVAALDYRRKTGKGQFIDAAQMESAIPLLGPILLQYEANGEEAGRTGNRSSYAAPHGVYRCKGENRWCAITVFSDEEWGNFCQVIGKPAWTESLEFDTLLGRLENVDELDRLVEEWTLGHSPEEVLNLMQGVGVSAGVVQSGKDLDGDPQLKHRHFYWDFDQPEIGKFTYSGLPAQLSKTPYEMKPAPMLGEHNEYVYTQLLGMSDEEFIDLMADGVFE
jgi:benzylsuccinate CoA-transferase BbsF subunit